MSPHKLWRKRTPLSTRLRSSQVNLSDKCLNYITKACLPLALLQHCTLHTVMIAERMRGHIDSAGLCLSAQRLEDLSVASSYLMRRNVKIKRSCVPVEETMLRNECWISSALCASLNKIDSLQINYKLLINKLVETCINLNQTQTWLKPLTFFFPRKICDSITDTKNGTKIFQYWMM